MRASIPTFARTCLLHRHTVLFGLLIATIAVGPLLSKARFGGALLDACLGLTLLVAALVPSGGRWPRRGVAWLLVVAIVLGVAALRAGPAGARPLTLIAGAVVAFIAATRALRYAVSGNRVDQQHVLAALNAYLLVGVFFGAIWFALEASLPASLLSGGVPFATGMPLPDGIYFSFVTLATLGYGDILPATPIARGLAIFEAVFGQLYLAVMVARLIGLRTADEREDAT